jgi:hypothetical protein
METKSYIKCTGAQPAFVTVNFTDGTSETYENFVMIVADPDKGTKRIARLTLPDTQVTQVILEAAGQVEDITNAITE